MKNKFKKFLLTSFISILLAMIVIRCASEGMPSGGPKDETGPTIIATSPASGATNVATGATILFEFSEPVDYKSVENSLTVFPYLETKPKIKISRNEVKIIPEEKLRDNTTYIFSFGRKIADYQNNITENEIKIAFSTGATIDQSLVTGKLYDYAEEKKTAYILFYDYEMIKPDSIIYYRPSYYTSVDRHGDFSASNIAAGNYAVVAYVGGFKDYPRYGEDNLTAVAFMDTVTIATGNDTLRNVNLRLHQYPLEDFKYLKAFEEEDKLQLMVSHAIDWRGNRDLVLKLNNQDFSQNTWYNKEKPDHLLVNMKGLDSAEYHLDIAHLRDIYGRQIIAARDTVLWTNPAIIDTLPPSPQLERRSKGKAAINEDILLRFSEPVQPIENLAPRVTFMTKDSNHVRFTTRQRDLISYEISPVQPLKYYTDYEIQVLTDSLPDRYGNLCIDSVKTLSFSTLNDDLFGSISGLVTSDLETEKIMIGCRHLEQENLQYTSELNLDNSYKLDKLQPGNYQMFIFYDQNSNGKYDWGSLVPYQSAEPYKDFGQPVEVRSRWETERINLKF